MMVFISKVSNYMFRPKAATFRLSQLQFCSKTYIYIYIYMTLFEQNCNCDIYVIFFFVALRPNAGHGPLILEVSRSHTTTHHSR